MATRKSSSRRASRPSKQSPTSAAVQRAAVRGLPMYFKGKRQSPEFASGAWAVCDVFAKMMAGNPAKNSSTEELTAKYADEFYRHVAKGGEYARGCVTSIVELLAFQEVLGTPNLATWRPLRMRPLFRRGEHPTPGSKLYELDGVAVSVAPDKTVHAWRGGEATIQRGIPFLLRVLKRGTPVFTMRKFSALRNRKGGSRG